MTRFSMFVKIKRNIFITILLMLVIEAALFSVVFSLQQKLSKYRTELRNSETLLKSAMQDAGNDKLIRLVSITDAVQGVAAIKDICNTNRIQVQNITTATSQEYITYRVTGESEYVKFIRFLSAIRKSEKIFRINSYAIKFTKDSKVSFVVEIQAMKNTAVNINAK